MLRHVSNTAAADVHQSHVEAKLKRESVGYAKPLSCDEIRALTLVPIGLPDRAIGSC